MNENRWEYYLEDLKFGNEFLLRNEIFTSKESVAHQAIRYFNRLPHNDQCFLYRFRRNQVQRYHPDTNEFGLSCSIHGEWESLDPRSEEFKEMQEIFRREL